MLPLFKKRALWLPTWPTVLALAVGLALAAAACVSRAHAFLCVTARAPGADTLVVEGWVSDDSLRRVVEILAEPESPYGLVCVTGPPLDHGYYLADTFGSYSELAAASLRALGVPDERLVVAPAHSGRRDRTYLAADALRAELTRRGLAPAALDLVTEGPHARRSRAVYAKVFGDDVRVGVIALPPGHYDAETWYRSSAGVKTTVFELLAVVYEWLGAGR